MCECAGPFLPPASVQCVFVSKGIQERKAATTGTNPWCGSGSCWGLHTLHLSSQWLVTGSGFFQRRPGLRYSCSFMPVLSPAVSTTSSPSPLLSSFSFQMEELRAHATDWTQNIQNMSVDFRMPGKIDDPFKRRRRKRRHGPRSHGHSVSANGVPEGQEEQRESQEESGSYSSSSSSSSNESGSGSETDSQATQTERVPEEKPAEPKQEEAPPDPHLSQPLDYFGENLAFIDESSDTQSGKLHLDPLLNPTKPNPRQPKRRRHRRPVPQRNHKNNSPNSTNEKEPNRNPRSVPDLPPKPCEW